MSGWIRMHRGLPRALCIQVPRRPRKQHLPIPASKSSSAQVMTTDLSQCDKEVARLEKLAELPHDERTPRIGERGRSL
eukprot:scaffold4321_cov33-Tisochrysis_lutea.AAC.6